MRVYRLTFAILAITLSICTAEAADRPLVGPVPAWVKISSLPPAIPAPGDAAVQTLLMDQQVKFSKVAVETYIDSRVRVQTAQGLAAMGTISLTWKPDSDVITVHRLVIRRGEHVEDLLGNGDGFTILRREDLLEQATLTGALTAIIQPAGLQVGDIVEMAYTFRHADPVVADTPDEIYIWPNAPIQQLQFRALWPDDLPMRWQASEFLPGMKVEKHDGLSELAYQIQDLQPLLQPKGAPSRYTALRRLEITSFQTWPQVAQRLAPLYVQAARLKPDSPLRAEVTRIRTQYKDPKDRAAAALKLVQQQIRYVLLAMNDGGLVPATADETWQRRYGDCKAKTVMLLALLHELGIEAQPLVVNTNMGDGMNERLPAVGLFNHVLVRATIAGRDYWMDGTRPADGSLDQLQIPDHRWALPLLAKGSELTRLQPEPLTIPQLTQSLHIDATAGLKVPAPFHSEAVFTGDVAQGMKLSWDNVPASNRDESLRAYWRKQLNSIDIGKVAADFDEKSGTMTWRVEGTMRLEWDDEYNTLEANDMVLGYRADFSRSKGTDANAPYAVSFPEYTVNRETILLPAQRNPFTVSGRDIDQKFAGMEFRRTAKVENNVFHAESSFRSIAAEFPASEAPAAERALRDMLKLGLYVKKPSGYLPTAKELAADAGSKLDTAGAYIDRAFNMSERLMYDDAINALTQAIVLDPKSGIAYANRAFSYIGKKDLEAARNDVDKAFALNPDAAVVLRARGYLAQIQGRTDEALESFTQSLQRENNSFATLHRAQIYFSKRDYENTLKDTAESIKSLPAADAYLLRVRALQRLGQRDAIQQLVDEILQKKVGAADGHALAGAIHDANDDREKARAEYDEAVKLQPDAQMYMARAMAQDDITRVRANLDAALAVDPRFEPALQLLVVLHLQQKQYKDALGAVDRLESISGVTLPTRTMRGYALTELGETEKALVQYEAARAMAPSADALNSLCWQKAIANQALPEAIKDCDAAVAKDPACAACIDSRGFVLLRMGRLEESISTYDQSLRLRPQQAESLFGRGLAKLRLGRKQEAEADIAAATSISPQVEKLFASYGVSR